MYFHTYNQTENTRFSQITMTRHYLVEYLINFFVWMNLFLVECLRYYQNIIWGYSELKIPTFPKFTAP